LLIRIPHLSRGVRFNIKREASRAILCRRYGMKPYRYYRQRRNTVMVRAPKRFLDQVLWPEFSELDQALQAYLHQVTLRVIRDEVFADASKAQEIPEALPPN
jgi:tRNA nucleotidyltransferase (CCA-adding enzyme)